MRNADLIFQIITFNLQNQKQLSKNNIDINKIVH